MRTALVLLLLAGTVGADVVELKDGRKFGGTIVEDGASYKVTTDSGIKTFLKDEVARVITSPAELLGDADKTIETIKQGYQDALKIPEGAAQSATMKELVGQLTKVRETYSAVRELFWEDKHAHLDQKMVQIMQLMRLLRERVGAGTIVKTPPRMPLPPSTPNPAPPPPPPGLDDALRILGDPAQRADAAKRKTASAILRDVRTRFPGGEDVAAAAIAFLARTDGEWQLSGPALAALQEYFSKPWMKEPSKLTQAAHLEAARFLADKNAAAKHPALALFGAAHLSLAPAGADADKAGQGLGFVTREGNTGTLEGLAILDLNRWIATANFDLGAIAYVKEFKGTAADTPAARFLWAVALTRHAQARRRGFERATIAFDSVKAPEATLRDHAVALAKSVKNVGVCGLCAGEGKNRCTGCHGRKEVRRDCEPCKGTGAQPGPVFCGPCKGKGWLTRKVCGDCKDGFPTCRRCDGRPRTAPEMDDIFMGAACSLCEGRGLAFSKVLWPCSGCAGLGQKLTPRADPTKILP